jgi:hypothetical protein
MNDQKSSYSEEEISENPEELSSEQQLIDLRLLEILRGNLASLESQNPGVHTVLSEGISSGFFTEHQGKKAINNLANQILLAIQKLEGENADHES